MNLITNEPSGLFLLPLGASLSNQVWQILDGLGLIFIPFAVIFISAFFTSRAQGKDEGSPAVLAIKLAEYSFWPMLIIMFFCIIPVSGNINTSYKQFSCMDEPSVSTRMKVSVSTASETALAAMGLSTTSAPPMLFGIVHQLSTGINEALTSTLTCKKGASAVDVSQAIRTLAPSTPALKESINAFNNQCFLPVRREILKKMSEGEELKNQDEIFNKYAWHFHEPDTVITGELKLMKDAYAGSIVKANPQSSFRMKPGSTWIESSQQSKEVDCYTLANTLYEAIKADISSSSIERTQTSIATVSTYFQTFISNEALATAMATDDLILAVYENSIYPKDTLYGGASVKTFANSIPDVIRQGRTSDAQDNKVATKSEIEGSSFATSLVALGAFFTDLKEGAKSMAATMVVPLMVVVFQLLLCAFLPLVGLLSGFKPKVMYSWILLYFAVTLVPFWLNFAVQLQSILMSLSSFSEFSNAVATNTTDTTFTSTHLMNATANLFVYIVPMVWMILVQIVGNIGASVVNSAISSSTDGGAKGAEYAEGTAQGLGKLAAKNSAKYTGNKIGGAIAKQRGLDS